MKELSAIEKLEAVKVTVEAFGYNFNGMTVEETFHLANILDEVIAGNLDFQTNTME
jgi:hypothetical protein